MTQPSAIAVQPRGEAWHSQSAEDVLVKLSSAASGLSATEAAKRLAADGPNELKEGKRISPWQIFLGQFKSLIIWILIVAGVVSGVLGEVVDAIAILAIVVLNAVIGFYQEFKAEESIAALKKMTAPQAKVRRDGHVTSIPAAGIVAGDILALEAGDLVAADARLLTAASLKCIESALTGESDAVTKQPATLEQGDVQLGDRENMLFMGTSVAAGTGQAVVVATAMKTELGRIAGLIAEAGAEEGAPLQKKLDSFGRILVWATLGIVALLFVLGLLRGTEPFELFMTSVSLAVAAVPEGLPAVVTVALALGVLRMSRRRALVRKLPAVETLGSTNVICTDKTGTLTVGEMTVRALFVSGQSYEVTGEGYGPGGEVRFDGKKVEAPHTPPLLELASVLLGCNNSHLVQEEGTWKTIGDPTEGALLAGGLKAGGDRERIEKELPKHHEIPFDSDRKRSTVIRKLPDGKLRAFTNGAPDVLLERCIQIFTSTGVRPMTDEELRKRAPKIAVYARVTAEHKLRIIRAWKANDAVVAMTGDGVNDAPAIKGADIGIAMGKAGTEVTKQAADMIVTDDNFASIVAAVEEGRGIYDNIRKTLQYLLAGNCGELLLMTAAIIMGLPMPLLAIHLLWINLVTDGLPALCLATDPIDPDVMKQPPRARHERITSGGFLSTMFLTGALTAGVSFAVYFYALKTETPELARTHAFAALVFAELLRSFGARSETRPLWRMNFLSNFNLLAVVAISFSIQVWSHHNAMLAKFLKTSLIPFSDCLMLLAVSTVPLLVLEARKAFSRQRHSKGPG